MEQKTVFDSCVCYATIQKILKSVDKENNTVVDESNYAKVVSDLLRQTVRVGSFEKHQDDFYKIASYFASNYNSQKSSEQSAILENLAKGIYAEVKDKDIKMFYLGGLALNMHTRANANESSRLVDRTSGDIDVQVEEEKLTEFLNIVNNKYGINSVEDRRVVPPEQRHIERFEKNGTPRSGPLVVMHMQNGMGIEIFPFRQIDNKIYGVGYYPQNGVQQAFLKQKNIVVEESGLVEDPPHIEVLPSFISKCNLGREKDFVDAYNLVASGCVQTEELNSFENSSQEVTQDTWHVSTEQIDDHSSSASPETVKYQQEHMGFGFNEHLNKISVETSDMGMGLTE